MSPRYHLLLLPAVLVSLAACGDDDDAGAETTGPDTVVSTIPDTAASTVPTTADVTSASSVSAPGTAIDDACALLPTEAITAATGMQATPGTADGGELRRVCVFRLDGAGVTVGVETADRFEDKAATSRRSLGVDGEEVAGLGDRALFFFSDDDIPEGVGGTLVGIGDTTVDVTLQGFDEATLRDASIAIAEVAVSNL